MLYREKGRVTCLIQMIGRRYCLALLLACAKLKSTFGFLQAFLHQLLSEKYLWQGNAASEPVTIRLRYKYGQDTGLSRKQGGSSEPRARVVEFIDPAYFQYRRLESIHFTGDKEWFLSLLRGKSVSCCCHHHCFSKSHEFPKGTRKLLYVVLLPEMLQLFPFS